MRSCQGRLVWILLAVAGLLLVVAVASAAVYLILQRQSADVGWQDPISAAVPDDVAPDLALYPLAGASVLDTVDAATVNGDLETAYAALVLSLELSDAQRIGRLILLGGQYVEAENPERAALTYQQVYDVAVLSPYLNDPARADALLASGQGWAVLGNETLATEAYDQVYLIAVQSPYLQMANRRDLLAALEPAYRDFGETQRADAVRASIVELEQQISPHPPLPVGQLPELPQGDEVISSPEVGALEEARRQAAFELLQPLSEGTDPPADLVAALAQALQAEDLAKLDLYRRELEGTTQPSRRINVSWHMIDWLMLKYKVASRGFGLSLVPEWEARVPEIQSALSKAYEGLFFDYEDLVTGLPDASLIGPGRYQVRRQVMLDGRLGRYPNYPTGQLVDKLQEAVRGLIDSGLVDPLYVDQRTEDEEIFFFLSPADEYGQSSQSP
ncbi:MAG TPA: hypothetical protein VLY63_13015 [Anaerolineae bacterium]|nr:hypothetical protein [Anaerolineae bacterium]